MSCCCQSSPCCCGGLTVNVNPTVCCTPTTESVEYSAENQNLIGVGVFNGQTDTLFGFRGIASDTLALTVTLDAPNNAIIISFNDELLIDDIPTFTETIRGIGEAATQAETNAGVSDNTIVTPLKLQNRTATETRTGIAEIATQAEVTTGTDDTRIVTPLKLATFAGTQFTTRTFADAVARAAAVPEFNGQLGIQLDTDALIMSTGTIAGTFTPNIVIGGTLAVTGNTTQSGTLTVNSLATFNGAVIMADASGVQFLANEVDFSGTTVSLSGTPIGATDSVLGQFGGIVDSVVMTQFLTAHNIQTGYTNFANPAVLRTCDTTTVTLPQLAQIVGTLINDLKAVLLPAT
jgi:hypothetical protein